MPAVLRTSEALCRCVDALALRGAVAAGVAGAGETGPAHLTHNRYTYIQGLGYTLSFSHGYKPVQCTIVHEL